MTPQYMDRIFRAYVMYAFTAFMVLRLLSIIAYPANTEAADSSGRKGEQLDANSLDINKSWLDRISSDTSTTCIPEEVLHGCGKHRTDPKCRRKKLSVLLAGPSLLLNTAHSAIMSKITQKVHSKGVLKDSFAHITFEYGCCSDDKPDFVAAIDKLQFNIAVKLKDEVICTKSEDGEKVYLAVILDVSSQKALFKEVREMERLLEYKERREELFHMTLMTLKVQESGWNETLHASINREWAMINQKLGPIRLTNEDLCMNCVL
mmetsp:Transcript_14048/g.21279  ORF Transcript_14048/g.21279 Transcript_14048/m.21279 type:complete len:263 (-) Transcript_14048:86-874(-)